MTEPLPLLGFNGVPVEKARSDKIERAFASYMSALAGVTKKPSLRAQDPFGNHVWVYAATMALAVNASQVPFKIYRETEGPKASSESPAVKRVYRSGRRRMAIARFLEQRSRLSGRAIRNVLPEYDHPLAVLFADPNPILSMGQIIELTTVMMCLRGACFWVKMTENGQSVGPGEVPDIIWPMDPNLFEPVIQNNTFLGWKVRIQNNDPFNKKVGFLALQPHEVAWFRYPHPSDMLGWQSPIAAAASAVDTDMQAIAYNNSVLRNGAKPSGILLHEDDISDEEEKKLRQYWKDRYEGPQNPNRMAMMTGNFKYIDIGLGPKEMEYLNQRKWDREEIFAALRVTKSVLSLTEDLNFSTQQSQDKNFWDKSLIPLLRMFEDVIDKSFFYQETDNIVGAFDFSKVDALRLGLTDQVAQAVQLCSGALHMPPDIAFDLVGLEVAPYEGSDLALIPGTLRTVEAVIRDSEEPAEDPVDEIDPEEEVDPDEEADTDNTPEPPGDERQPRPADDKEEKDE